MRYREIGNILGKFFLSFSAVLLIPLAASLYFEFVAKASHLPDSPSLAIALTVLACLCLGGLFSFFGRNAEGALFNKESIVAVVMIWLLTPVIGALPLGITQVLKNPLDAYFEAMSALTTTGATVIHSKNFDSVGQETLIRLSNPHNASFVYTFYGTVEPFVDPGTHETIKTGLEALGDPLLFWLSFLQWLGGLGIVIVFLAALPSFPSASKCMYEIGMSGHSKENITPRIKETLNILCKIYFGMTLLQIALLKLTDPSLLIFHAITLSFATISTGGFTIFNDGLGHIHHTGTLGILLIFMLLGSINFSLYYNCFKGKFKALKDPELFAYLGSLLLGTLFLFIPLWKAGLYPFAKSLGFSLFQVVSAQSSTGFPITNYDAWPLSCQTLLLFLTFLGGMSGSTAGGLKIIRVMIVFKLIKQHIVSFFRPCQTQILKIGQKEIPDKAAQLAASLFCFSGFCCFIGAYLLILDGNDPFTSFGVIATCINNAGCYFEGIGSTQSLAYLSNFSKCIALFFMILGRLELFTLFALFFPSFWRSR